jgi:hypothetical protein
MVAQSGTTALGTDGANAGAREGLSLHTCKPATQDARVRKHTTLCLPRTELVAYGDVVCADSLGEERGNTHAYGGYGVCRGREQVRAGARRARHGALSIRARALRLLVRSPCWCGGV